MFPSGGGELLERVEPVASQWRRETRSFSRGQSRSTMKRSAEGVAGFQAGVLMFGVLDMSALLVYYKHSRACTLTYDPDASARLEHG